MAYIYKITNDINQKIYIGKTEFSIEKRFKEHCFDAFRDRNEKRPLYAAMRKYGIEHFYIELIEETNNPEEREIYWIEQYGSFKNGYNATIGGDGKKYLNYDLIEKTYLQVQNINETAKILNCSTDSVRKILKNKNIIIKASEEININKFGKIIGQFDKKSKELLNVYSSIKEAARSINKPNGYTHISACALGKRKTAYNYIWKFL